MNKLMNFKNKNGITLIALVITVIVLLILAGISISMLSGDNSILQRATDAKEKTERQGLIEQARTDILGYQVENKGGDLSKTQLKSVLDKYFDKVPDLTEMEKDAILNTELETLPKYGTQTIKVYEIYDGNISEQGNAGTVKIAYSLNKNTITMNFEQGLENVFVELTKAYNSDYYAEQYPGEEITIDLIYEAYDGANSLQQIAEYSGYYLISDLIMSYSGNDGFEDIVGDGITGTISLKKGDIVIKQGDVSLLNDLEYTLTELGTYTIIGETSDGIKVTKTFEHEELSMDSFYIAPVRGGWEMKTFQVISGLTFEQWIEKEHPEHFVVSNGYVYYDEYNPGVYDDTTAICQSFRKISATSTIYSETYVVGVD